MIILGHALVPYEPLYLIKNGDEVFKYDNLLFKFNDRLIAAAQKAQKKFSVITNDINEILLANGAGARFIIVDKKSAATAQKLANDYLFDAKIAMFIGSARALKNLSELGIDAAIFKDAIANAPKSLLASIGDSVGFKFHFGLPKKDEIFGGAQKLADKISALDKKLSAPAAGKNDDIWKK